MTINRECFYKSLKSDMMIALSLLVTGFGIIVGLILLFVLIGYFILPILGSIADMLFSLSQLSTAYSWYIIYCLFIIVTEVYSLLHAPKENIGKYASILIGACFLGLVCMGYLLYIQLSNIPVCQEGIFVGLCRINPILPFPSVFIETILTSIWILVSTPLIVAYRRCNE